MRDLYETLGVKSDATKQQIKDAYRNKAKSHHPDKKGDEAEFKTLNYAYTALTDDTRRKQYDETGIDESQDKLTTEAQSILQRMFFDLMRKYGPVKLLKVDVVRKLHEIVAKVKLNVAQKESLGLTKLKEFENLATRIEHKKKTNMFSNVINHEIEQCKIGQKNLKKEMMILNHCSTVLKEYGFNFDPEIIRVTMNIGQNSTAGTTFLHNSRDVV